MNQDPTPAKPALETKIEYSPPTTVAERARRAYAALHADMHHETLAFAELAALCFFDRFYPRIEPDHTMPKENDAGQLDAYLADINARNSEMRARVVAELVAAATPVSASRCRLQWEGYAFDAHTLDDLNLGEPDVAFAVAITCATCGGTVWNPVGSPEVLGWLMDDAPACPLCANVPVPYGARLSLADLSDLTAAKGASAEQLARAEFAHRQAAQLVVKLKALAVREGYTLNVAGQEGEDPKPALSSKGNAETRKAAEAAYLAKHGPYQAALVAELETSLALALARTVAEQAADEVSLYRAWMYRNAPARPHA